MNKYTYAVAAAAVIAAFVGGRYSIQTNQQSRVGALILQSCATFGHFEYIDRNFRLAKIQCQAPTGARFLMVDGELVVEFDHPPDTSRAVRL